MMVPNARLVEIFLGGDGLTDYAELQAMAKDLWYSRRMLAAIKETGVEFPHLPQIHPQKGDTYA